MRASGGARGEATVSDYFAVAMLIAYRKRGRALKVRPTLLHTHTRRLSPLSISCRETNCCWCLTVFRTGWAELTASCIPSCPVSLDSFLPAVWVLFFVDWHNGSSVALPPSRLWFSSNLTHLNVQITRVQLLLTVWIVCSIRRVRHVGRLMIDQ